MASCFFARLVCYALIEKPPPVEFELYAVLPYPAGDALAVCGGVGLSDLSLSMRSRQVSTS